jgi:hypothetical protein
MKGHFMSKRTAEKLPDQGFMPEGFTPFPSLHSDSLRVSEFAEWETENLEARVNAYTEFLQTDCMPRARMTGERIVNHILFELAYRDGVYNEQ